MVRDETYWTKKAKGFFVSIQLNTLAQKRRLYAQQAKKPSLVLGFVTKVA